MTRLKFLKDHFAYSFENRQSHDIIKKVRVQLKGNKVHWESTMAACIRVVALEMMKHQVKELKYMFVSCQLPRCQMFTSNMYGEQGIA